MKFDWIYRRGLFNVKGGKKRRNNMILKLHENDTQFLMLFPLFFLKIPLVQYNIPGQHKVSLEFELIIIKVLFPQFSTIIFRKMIFNRKFKTRWTFMMLQCKRKFELLQESYGTLVYWEFNCFRLWTKNNYIKSICTTYVIKD